MTLRAWLLLFAVIVGVLPAVAAACPFCGAVGQPLAARRAAAAAVAVAEPAGPASVQADGVILQPFVLHQRLAGQLAVVPGEELLARVDAPVQGTAAVFLAVPDQPDRPVRHTAVSADETRLGYLAAAPPVTQPAAVRLRWFARWLEHPDPVLAQDAYAEFGLAPFEAVREAADALPAADLSLWVNEVGINQQRRGFYGLALGLVAAVDPQQRDACRAALQQALTAPADDFRGGFDGILAGVLVADGAPGLEMLIARGLLEVSARPVEKRQMLAVLRFAWESLSEEIPREQVAHATARLLASPVTAAEAAVDLARYRWWEAADAVAALWDMLGDDDPLIRRAVAGYLTACPTPRARELSAAIRRHDADRFDQAVAASQLPLLRSP